MSRSSDAEFVQAVIAGQVGPLADGAAARLTIMRAQHRDDAGLIYLISQAFTALTAAADRAYLEDLIAGSPDLLSAQTFSKLEPMFERYPEGSGEMALLLAKAADVYGGAAIEAAYRELARHAIQEAQRRARGY